MADYTVIADISNALVGLLRSQMIPEVLLNEESIGVCSPENKGDMRVGLYLYDVKQSEMYNYKEMINLDLKYQKYPSIYLELYYMITTYSNGDVTYRSIEEQKLLGRAIQIFADYNVLDAQSYTPAIKSDEPSISIEQMSLSIEEKMKLWSFPNKSYKNSIYYKVAPVELDSRRTRKIQRVLDLEFSIKEQKEWNGKT